MPRRLGTRRFAVVSACVTVLGALVGCGAPSDVTFTNVSESWLNVRFFVESGTGSDELVSKRNFQVRPGETTRFKIHRRTSHGTAALVHMQAQNVPPSWDPPSKQHWMELLTQDPVKVVASGKGEKLEFEVGDGEVARIPKRQLKRRFNYHIVGAPEQE